MKSLPYLHKWHTLLLIFAGILLLVAKLGLAAVTLIAPNEGGPKDSDGSYVYWLTGLGEFCSPPGMVERVRITGGTVETLYSSCDFSPASLRVDGAQIYILDWHGDDVVKLPTSGGLPVTIADAQGAVYERGFDTDENFVYWADEAGVKRAAKNGTGTVTLVSKDIFGVGLRGVTVDDTYAYYLQYNYGGSPVTYAVKRVPKSGGAAQTLYSSPGSSCWDARQIHVDSSHIYWLEDKCDEPNVMNKMPKDGSAPPTTLFNAGAGRVMTFVELKSNVVFFTESEHPNNVLETTGKVRYLSTTGGAVADIATGLTLPNKLATDNQYLYWSDRSTVGGGAGIKRADIPAAAIDNDGDGFPQAVDCDDNNPAVSVGNTCVSDEPVTVESDSGEVTVTFPEVTGGGTTTITVEECTEPVEGITLTPTRPLCVDIETDATFEGEAKVCVTYDDTGLTPIQETFLSMVRCTGGTCELLTCDPSEIVDIVNNIVCGCVDGFSMFAVGIPLDTDGDFTPDLLDNCPNKYNIWQEDADGDGFGDVCDNCPNIYDPTNQCIDECRGDIDGDSDIDGSDLSEFAAAFGTSIDSPFYNEKADFDSNGVIDEDDLSLFAERFGETDCN